MYRHPANVDSLRNASSHGVTPGCHCQWEKDRPWLALDTDVSKPTMYCLICGEHCTPIILEVLVDFFHDMIVGYAK
jgi:hypothetical protein